MPQDALELLKHDHDAVKKLLDQLAKTTDGADKKRQDLLDEIEKELTIHTKIEEEIFYPAFRDAGGKQHDKLDVEAREEHRAVDALVLPDLKKTDPAGVEFAGRVKVLKDLIEHHAEEEEDEMFAKARKAMSKDQLRELGERMESRKQELQKQM